MAPMPGSFPGSEDEASSLVLPPMPKRQHALHELLSSERSYASDLALICDVHIPLALGHQCVIHTRSIDPASSSRTVSTASDTSPQNALPMNPEDTRIIFNNIEELAIFSESLCDKLEKAIGAGESDDRVGALFLAMVCSPGLFESSR